MKPGDLVKIKRHSIGVPIGTVGLIIDTQTPGGETSNHGYGDLMYYVVQITHKKYGVLRRRYLRRDLEVINEAG